MGDSIGDDAGIRALDGEGIVMFVHPSEIPELLFWLLKLAGLARVKEVAHDAEEFAEAELSLDIAEEGVSQIWLEPDGEAAEEPGDMPKSAKESRFVFIWLHRPCT